MKIAALREISETLEAVRLAVSASRDYRERAEYRRRRLGHSAAR